MMIDKNKVEEAAGKYSERVSNGKHFRDLQCGFEVGVSYAEQELSNTAIEFGKFISNHPLDLQPGDVTGEGVFIGLDMKYYSAEELFQEFLKEYNG